jgi:ABC-type glutathione transport system ATPase component
VVLTTHQLAFSEGLAERAVVLHDGRVVDAGDYSSVVAGGEASRLGLRWVTR